MDFTELAALAALVVMISGLALMRPSRSRRRHGFLESGSRRPAKERICLALQSKRR